MSDQLQKPKAGDPHRITLPGGEVMVFRYIPAGRFRMGQRGTNPAEEPVHWVEVEDFWLGETPVTQAQFAMWTQARGIEHKNRFAGKTNHPAENMDWYQAVAFCEWLGEVARADLPAEHRWPQLPNEAQWEYACRAGTETEYYTGDGEAALRRAGWFDEPWEGGSTHPVASPEKEANAWNLHDLHGNVWEWCADVWDVTAYGLRADGWRAAAWTADDAGIDDRICRLRVLRGGTWNNSARHCRAAVRYDLEASGRLGRHGVRVCLARRPPAERRQGEAEPRPLGEPRRDDEVEPDGLGSAGAAGLDFTRERLPRR